MNNIMGYEKFKIKHGHDYSRQRLICLIIIIVTASRRNVCSRGKNSSAVWHFPELKNTYIYI